MKLEELKVGDTLIFTGYKTLPDSGNMIRARYYLVDAGLRPGIRCQVTKIGKFYALLDCPNGEYEFGDNSIEDDFIKCPRDTAFETLGILD